MPLIHNKKGMILTPQDILELQKNWDCFGKEDPLWAISSDKEKKGGKWNSKDFFQKGIETIDNIMKESDSLKIKISYNRALDFGCGVGRLTQPLAKYFDLVAGVDISPSMIELANSYNKFGDRVKYYLNNINNLEIFKNNSFDFIVSMDVLQHMHPKYQENYLKEFLRILSPEGLLVFQSPSEYVKLFNKAKGFLNINNFISNIRGKLTNQAIMEYYLNPKKNVESFLLNHGAKHVYAIKDSRTTVISYIYFVRTKPLRGNYGSL